MTSFNKVFSEDYKPSAEKMFDRLAASFKERNQSGIETTFIAPKLPSLRLHHMVDDYEELLKDEAFRKK
jgi:hypothetical protein